MFVLSAESQKGCSVRLPDLVRNASFEQRPTAVSLGNIYHELLSPQRKSGIENQGF